MTVNNPGRTFGYHKLSWDGAQNQRYVELSRGGHACCLSRATGLDVWVRAVASAHWEKQPDGDYAFSPCGEFLAMIVDRRPGNNLRRGLAEIATDEPDIQHVAEMLAAGPLPDGISWEEPPKPKGRARQALENVQSAIASEPYNWGTERELDYKGPNWLLLIGLALLVWLLIFCNAIPKFGGGWPEP